MNLAQIEIELKAMSKSQAHDFSFEGANDERFVFQTKAPGEGTSVSLSTIHSDIVALEDSEKESLLSNMNNSDYALGGSGRPCK